jgi:hypothetical protein
MAVEVRQKAKTYTVNLYGKPRDVCAYDAVVMMKTLKSPVRVVWVFRNTQWVAMFTTDLALSVTQIIGLAGKLGLALKRSNKTLAAGQARAN